MGQDRTDPETIAAELPEIGQEVRPLSPAEQPRTLGQLLGPLVDRVRQIKTDLGLSPYRVFLVHVLWQGQLSRKGDGIATEISRVEILPAPRVLDMSATTELLSATALGEGGGLTVDRISARYSEDDLMGRTSDLQDPSMPRTSLPNAEFFWEVVQDRVAEPQAVRRRYVPAAAPHLDRSGVSWRITLSKLDYDRGRGGVETPRQVY
jgi:hypothetical protein